MATKTKSKNEKLEFADVFELLSYLQNNIAVEKNRTNPYGGFDYFNLDDIYKEVKPLLEEIEGASLYWKPVQDEFLEGRHNKRTTAVLRYRNSQGEVTEYETSSTAREDESEAKKSASQVSGSTETYAKKMTLRNMFMIGGELDSDSENPEEKGKKAHLIDRAKKALHPTPEMLEEWQGMNYKELYQATMKLHEEQQQIL